MKKNKLFSIESDAKESSVPVLLATEDSEATEAEFIHAHKTSIIKKISTRRFISIFIISSVACTLFSFLLLLIILELEGGPVGVFGALLMSLILIFIVFYSIFIIKLALSVYHRRSYFNRTSEISVFLGILLGLFIILCYLAFYFFKFKGILYVIGLPLIPIIFILNNLLGAIVTIF